MSIRMIAIFSVGATVGYTAHRTATPAAASTPAAREVSMPERPPPRLIVVAPASPSLPAPVVEPAVEPPADASVTPEPDTDPYVPRGVLEGKVTDARTGEPIPSVRVVTESLVGTPLKTYTDGDGAYQLVGLPSAAYKVHFTYYGGDPVERQVGINQLDPTELDVTLDRGE
jgi:hypothetical protein